MSAVYPTFKAKLWEFMLGTKPGTTTLKLAVGDSSCVYNAAHTELADLTGILYYDFGVTVVSYANGLLKLADLLLEGMGISDDVACLILYADWTSGNQLVAFIDDTSDASLPVELLATAAQVNWSTSGVMQL